MSETAITKRTAISNHRIQLFRCPHLFYQMVFRKFKELKNQAAEKGTWAHTFLEKYVRHLLDTGENQDTVYGESLFNELWISRPMPPEFKQELFDITVGYINAARFDIQKVVDPEISVNLDWELNQLDSTFDESVWLRAKIDLLSFYGENNEHAIVDDYKSSWRMVSESELREDTQALIYAWLVFQICKSVETVKVRFRWIRFKRSTETLFSKCDVDHIEGLLRDLSNQIEYRASLNETPEKAWPPVPGDVCTFCPVQCPIAQKLADTDQIVTSFEQATRLAQEYIVLDKAYDQRKKLLKIWIDENGPINVGGKAIGYVAEVRKTYDGKTIVDTLMGLGLDVEGIFNLTSDGVKNFIKQHPETAGLFSSYCTEKSQTKFMIADPDDVISDVDKQPKPKPKKEKKKKVEPVVQEAIMPDEGTITAAAQSEALPNPEVEMSAVTLQSDCVNPT